MRFSPPGFSITFNTVCWAETKAGVIRNWTGCSSACSADGFLSSCRLQKHRAAGHPRACRDLFCFYTMLLPIKSFLTRSTAPALREAASAAAAGVALRRRRVRVLQGSSVRGRSVLPGPPCRTRILWLLLQRAHFVWFLSGFGPASS